MEFEKKISQVYLQIRRSEKPMAIFTVDDQIFCVTSEGPRFKRMINDPETKFIGVYNKMIARDDLSCDISLIIDEIPEPDECKQKTT